MSARFNALLLLLTHPPSGQRPVNELKQNHLGVCSIMPTTLCFHPYKRVHYVRSTNGAYASSRNSPPPTCLAQLIRFPRAKPSNVLVLYVAAILMHAVFNLVPACILLTCLATGATVVCLPRLNIGHSYEFVALCSCGRVPGAHGTGGAGWARHHLKIEYNTLAPSAV